MPSRAPTYYSWCHEKPLTTNQTYGYFMKEYADAKAREPAKPKGPFDHTRPFSNAGFFPHIGEGGTTGKMSMADQKRMTRSVAFRHTGPASSVSKFNINYGYVVGHVPVTEKIAARSSAPSGYKLSRSVSAPPVYRYVAPPTKDTFLWHTLSGTLVHVKNRAPQPDDM